MSQAVAIVDDVRAPAQPDPAIGSGIYFGITGAIVLVLFGMTIVFKRVAKPYAESEDDDV